MSSATILSDAQFMYRKVSLKFSQRAHEQSMTTRAFLVRQVRACPSVGKTVKSSEKSKPVEASEGEAEAKKEKKREKKEKDGRAEPKSADDRSASPAVTEDGGSRKSFAPPSRGSVNGNLNVAEMDEDDLKRMVAELEQEL